MRIKLIIQPMVINMNETKLRAIGQLRDFLRSSADIEFCAQDTDDDRYAHISQVLKRFSYPQLSKPVKGVVRGYLERTSGYSRAQPTRECRVPASAVEPAKAKRLT